MRIHNVGYLLRFSIHLLYVIVFFCGVRMRVHVTGKLNKEQDQLLVIDTGSYTVPLCFFGSFNCRFNPILHSIRNMSFFILIHISYHLNSNKSLFVRTDLFKTAIVVNMAAQKLYKVHHLLLLKGQLGVCCQLQTQTHAS